jgi:beta-galactosidase
VATRATARLHRGVTLAHGGLVVDGAAVPLVAGSVHYWRLDPRDWRACLDATKALGVRLVDTYVPWGVHETAPGEFDFGDKDPRLDLARFLELARDAGLYAIVRPGPHINAELTYFGLPERIVWDAQCQARSSEGSPVMLPMLPVSFPVPSYASEAFHDETARWFRAVGAVVAPRLHPAGPVVLVQVDNEGALYFRDGAYDQDYHPDAVARFRAFVREKYGSLEALAEAYGPPPAGDEEARFATLAPPTRFDAKGPGDLARHLDWAEFHEELLASAFTRFSRALEAAGIEGVPTSHNLPPGQDATPLNPARVAGAVDLVGIDYYHPASEPSRAIIARRTTELASRCEGLAVPAFGAEMGAGFPPFFPPLDARDNAFALMTALAYGLRAFNLYMAVERDRWIGAPIDRRGRARPSASFFRRLTRALDASDFFSLTRRAPVLLLRRRRGTADERLGGGARPRPPDRHRVGPLRARVRRGARRARRPVRVDRR